MQRIERTIRELIDFSRPASTAVSRVRLGEVVDEALGIAKYYQRTKERTITDRRPADLPAVVGVRDYLTQVVLNLVLNAIDATDDQGRIHVAARLEDDWLVLSVEDDGRGISIADRCRLFQPFFTTKAHGTGLGLFVSRQILEDHGGTLSFHSEPGQGVHVLRSASREARQARSSGNRQQQRGGPAIGRAGGATTRWAAGEADLGRPCAGAGRWRRSSEPRFHEAGHAGNRER